MQYFTKEKLEQNVKKCNDFLQQNSESHHLYEPIKKECSNWAFALKELEDLGLNEIPLNPKTNFVNMI